MKNFIQKKIRFNYYRIILILVFYLFFGKTVSYTENYDIDYEISKVKTELEKISLERKNVAEFQKNDLKEFNEYKKRFDNKIKKISLEFNSVKDSVREYSGVRDSIKLLINSLKNKSKEQDLLNEYFKNALIRICDKEINLIKSLSPSISKQCLTLDYIKSELSAGTISNVEAMNRIVGVLDNLENDFSDIQIQQGKSPITEIGNDVYRLRIGAIFEAIVSLDGKAGAVWSFEDSQWIVLNDPSVIEELYKSINVREGRILPEFVNLPFAVKKGDYE